LVQAEHRRGVTLGAGIELVEQRLRLRGARAVAFGVSQFECCPGVRDCLLRSPNRRQDPSEFNLCVCPGQGLFGPGCVLGRA
jgi:hypothetical protein